MNRLSITMSNVWLRIRRTRAKLLARIYAQYKRKSSPVRMGERTIYFETYCPLIERVCDELGIMIPVVASRVPNKTEEWFMAWRFGWPDWPVRMARYNGKMLEDVSITVDEIAHSCQYVWNKAGAPSSIPRETTPTALRQSHNAAKKENVVTAVPVPVKKKLTLDPGRLAEEMRKNAETIDIISRHFESDHVEQIIDNNNE